MDHFVQQGAAFRDPAAMVERVRRDAVRAFADRADPAQLDDWAREAVAALWTDATRVTTFIPTLALREIGERLEARNAHEPREVLEHGASRHRVAAVV